MPKVPNSRDASVLSYLYHTVNEIRFAVKHFRAIEVTIIYMYEREGNGVGVKEKTEVEWDRKKGFRPCQTTAGVPRNRLVSRLYNALNV